jgi:hypothetical protein
MPRALLIGGLYLLHMHVLVARISMGGVVLEEAFLVAVGAAWLWLDIIEPMTRGKGRREPRDRRGRTDYARVADARPWRI